MGMTMEDAGVLMPGGEQLTEGAKYKYIEDVMNAMRLGSNWDPGIMQPCGPEIPPMPLNFPVPNLHDEITYSDWHSNALGNYLAVAKALNMQGMMPFMPIIFDPIALAVSLNLKVPSIKFGEFPSLMLNVPALLLKLELTIDDLPSLLLKVPGLPSPFPPQFPIPKLNIPNLPAIMIPDLWLMLDAMLKIPLQIPSLLLPNAILPLLMLDFSGLCGAILKLFPTGNGPNPLLQIATYKVLTVKFVECVAIDVIGLTLGSASGGAVGGMGSAFGYVPPESKSDKPTSVRDRIIKFAKKVDGLSYSSDKEKYTITLLPDMTYKNDNSHGDLGNRVDKDDQGNTGKVGKPKPQALQFAATASSCGMFARACLLAAGASGESYFDKSYKPGTAISGLMSVAYKRKAVLFDRTKGDKIIPPVKKGDIIIVGEDDAGVYPFHVQIVTKNYDGGVGKTNGICGGAADEGNPITGQLNKFYPTKIASSEYVFTKKSEGGFTNFPFAGTTKTDQRPIFAILDSEKIVNV